MKRRDVLLGLGVSAIAAAGTGAAVFRLHATPRVHPFLTDQHLRRIGQSNFSAPRILFVGNSMLLRHDIPSLVAKAAGQDGMTIRTATAAATGARLIETYRIAAFRNLFVSDHWGAIVLQDFSETSLRQSDRWGSAFAIQQLAQMVVPTPVILYPPFPPKADHPVYRDAGKLKHTPENPDDYAARTMAHYQGIADRNGLTVAPVPAQWMVHDTAAFYDSDGHHASPAGAAFVAKVLWKTLRGVLAASPD